ncbi:MAG: type II secretion system protein GspH, partial [Methylibium sp.]|nr:type II secretion system protein GspH [Methylibium sp.]
GVVVRWVPGGEDGGFRFVGLPASLEMPTQWLGDEVGAEVLTEFGPAVGALLGPEPVIGAQRIVLRVDSQMLMLATDGLGPFVVTPAEAESRAAR